MPFDRLSEAEDVDDSGTYYTREIFSIYFFLLREGWRFPLEESDCLQN
jgi:hypothetical protein